MRAGDSVSFDWEGERDEGASEIEERGTLHER